MGMLYHFECPGCGYSADVSGGDDRGFVAVTTTIICRDCGKLYDVGIGKYGEAGSFAEIPIRCPRSKKHPIERWTDPGLCPRCGKLMTGMGGCVLWD